MEAIRRQSRATASETSKRHCRTSKYYGRILKFMLTPWLILIASTLTTLRHIFFSNIDRILSENYAPSSVDILRSRYRTTSVVETHFSVQNALFRIIDVGGQRGERSKWVWFFEDITAVLFCAAISEYDQKLEEDNETNRLQESLDLFESICKLKVFRDTAIMLFLNKDDIFRAKLQKVPLTVCFPNYTGPQSDYKGATSYIIDRFEERKHSASRIIYAHITCATDTESFQKVLLSTQDIILNQALAAASL